MRGKEGKRDVRQLPGRHGCQKIVWMTFFLTITQEVKVKLTSRYNAIATDGITNLERIFDIESFVKQLRVFSFQNGKITVSRGRKAALGLERQ